MDIEKEIARKSYLWASLLIKGDVTIEPFDKLTEKEQEPYYVLVALISNTPIPVPCPECKGSKQIQYGAKNINPVYKIKCPTCKGTGQVSKSMREILEEA